MKATRAIIILLLIFSRQNSTAQFVKLFSDSLKTLKPSLAVTNIIEKNGFFYMANQSSDGVGTVQTLVKLDTAGNTVWTTHPLNYIDAGVFNQNRAFQKIVFGIEGGHIYSLLDGARIGKIRESNGSMDWIGSVTNIFGSSRVNFIDYDSVSVVYANAAASFNTVRICRVSKSNGQNIGYVDLPCNQPAGFGIYIIDRNIYLASRDTCYKYTSFDNPTLLWKTKISNSFGFSDIGSFDQSGNDLLIFGSRNSTFSNGRIACVDKQTGTFKWLTELGGSYSVSHADHKIKNGSLYTAWEHVYVGSVDERCLTNKINLSTGAMVWQFNHAFRTQYVVALPTEAMVSFDIDDNEMIYMTGYGLPDNYTVKSWGFMKIRGSDGAVLKRNYIPDLAPLSPDYSRSFFLKLINNKPYSIGFRASNLAKALLDTADLSVIQNQLMIAKIQFPSALVGMASFSDTKKILLKKVGKGLKIEMVDASYNRIWEKLLSDTINFYKGYDFVFVNDSTKKIYAVARGYAYASANNFFFYYTPNSADGHTVYEFDSLGNNTNSYYEDDSPYYITPMGFFLDSMKRTMYLKISSTSLGPQGIPLSVGLFYHYWTPRSYPLYKPRFYYSYSKDTAYSFGGSGPGTWGPARFVKEWPPYFDAQTRIYPILNSLYLTNSVERESKTKYYIVGKDSTWKDMLLKYSTSDSSVVWYKKFDSSIITYKCFYQNSAIYAISSQNKNILLRKFNSDDGSLIWTMAIPVPVNNYLKLMDFDMSKQRSKITIAGNLIDTVANRDMSKIFAITIDTSGVVVNQFIKDGYRSWTNQGASVFIANDGQTLIGGQISDSVYGFAGFIYAIDTSSTSSGGVAPSQPGAINGNNSICQNSSQTYSVNPVAGATSYTWTLPAGWTGTSSSNTINVTVGASGGTISVTANNIYGTSPLQVISITVNPVPAQPGAITGSASPCNNSSQTYSVTAVAGATSYTWTIPAGWSGTSTTNSINVVAGSSGGSVSVKANNACGSSTAQLLSVTVTNVPAQPGGITGSASPCINSSQTYSVIAVAGDSSYTWTLPSGWSGTSTTNSISVTAGNSGGTISVQANNTCGSGAIQSLLVNTSQVPAQPGIITGSASPCVNSSQTYSVSAVAGATSYTWTLPSGWSGTSTTNSITVTVGNTTGSVSVKANNNCGSSANQNLPVTPGPVPAQPGTISGNTSVTSGQTTNYSIITVPNTTGYTWLLSGGGTVTAGQNTNAISITWSTQGSYFLTVKAVNNCGNSDSTSIMINVSPTTGVINPDNRFQLKVMPNPTTDVFYVSAKGVINKNITIEIMNTLGQKIYSTQVRARINDFAQMINLGKAASGIYRVKIIIGTDVYLRSIMKQ
jgi:hypothetical protein